MDLPDMIKNDVPIMLPENIRSQYTELETKFILELADAEILAFSASALSTKLRQFVQGFLYDAEGNAHKIHTQKLEALKDVVENAGGPVLVAIQFRHEYEMINNFFKKEYGDIPVIYGGVGEKECNSIMEKWNRGEIPILVGNSESIALGLNMQFGGNTIVWYGLTWNFGTYQQFNKRLHRQGQGKPVTIHHLVMEDTIDQIVVSVLKSKERTMARLIDELIQWRKN